MAGGHADVGEDLVGMCPHVTHLVDLGDRAVRTDQERDPLRDGGGGIVGWTTRSVRLADAVVDVAQQLERELLRLRERTVRVDGVERDAEDLGIR